MAVCSTEVTAPSCQLGRLINFNSTKLSASRSVWCAPFLRNPAVGRGLFMVSQPRITPKMEAKKETFSSFDDLLENSDKPVLVDFYATWCGPCQFMVPILEEVSTVLKDKIQVVKIDTEKETSIANHYKIEALPAFIIFRDGKPCYRFEGAMPANQLIQLIEDALKVPQ